MGYRPVVKADAEAVKEKAEAEKVTTCFKCNT